MDRLETGLSANCLVFCFRGSASQSFTDTQRVSWDTEELFLLENSNVMTSKKNSCRFGNIRACAQRPVDALLSSDQHYGVIFPSEIFRTKAHLLQELLRVTFNSKYDVFSALLTLSIYQIVCKVISCINITIIMCSFKYCQFCTSCTTLQILCTFVHELPLIHFP